MCRYAEVLKSNFVLLKNVYKHYAPGGSMSNLDFWAMVRDCGLEDDSVGLYKLEVSCPIA